MLRHPCFRMARVSGLLLIALIAGCAARRAAAPHRGVFILRWVERPNPRGPSTAASPADRVHFDQFLGFDRHLNQDFAAARAALREGDLIAYRMSRREARRAILTGKFNKAGYDLLQYGHLAIVVRDPARAGLASRSGPSTQPASVDSLRLFSSQSFIGPNTREGLDTLADHDWDAYRLNQWDRVDTARLYEFIRQVENKAGCWYGYDFSGMFGLWNSDLRPATPRRIGNDYICSTVVLAALYYSGVELDAVRNNGWLDICTPLQVVRSPGRLTTPPPATLSATDTPTIQTIPLAGIDHPL